jgi:hypothetical protein
MKEIRNVGVVVHGADVVSAAVFFGGGGRWVVELGLSWMGHRIVRWFVAREAGEHVSLVEWFVLAVY